MKGRVMKIYLGIIVAAIAATIVLVDACMLHSSRHKTNTLSVIFHFE
jgi:hypothetical protein